jgi:dynein heavy chain
MEPFEDPENWPEPDELKSSIIFHQNEEKRLQEEIPEEIICSVFKISTKVIRDLLASKHRKIADEKIELIGKIAKDASAKILKQFDEYNMKVEAVPKNIEELSAIKDLMQSLPNELNKQMATIKKCMNIYEMLNEFHYKFEDEEEYDKMWHVYGSPKETMERIEKQQGFLEKEKEKFIKQMDNNKSDFTENIMKLDVDCLDIKKYKDVDQYEEVANMVKSIQTRLNEATDYAKMINNRESLVELEDVTDYQGIEQTKKGLI